MQHSSHFPLSVRMCISILAVYALVSCAPSQPRLTGVAYEYDSAKDMLKKGRFDKALEFSEAPAKASPPNRSPGGGSWSPAFPGAG